MHRLKCARWHNQHIHTYTIIIHGFSKFLIYARSTEHTHMIASNFQLKRANRFNHIHIYIYIYMYQFRSSSFIFILVLFPLAYTLWCVSFVIEFCAQCLRIYACQTNGFNCTLVLIWLKCIALLDGLIAIFL